MSNKDNLFIYSSGYFTAKWLFTFAKKSQFAYKTSLRNVEKGRGYLYSQLKFVMQCREKCGACCIAPSISSSIPGMPNGKPAGVACIHLSEDYQCLIYNHPDRPKVCDDFKADPEVCGTSRKEAMNLLGDLEKGTSASGSP